MARTQSRFGPFLLAVIGGLCVLVGYQAAGERGVIKAPPNAIATVDLNRVMNGLAQWDKAVTELQAMQDGYLKEQKQQDDAITADIERLRSMEDTPEARALEEQIALARLNLDALRAFNREVLDIEMALRLEDFYNTVKVAIEQMAQAEGYDAVYVDDSQGRLRKDAGSGVSRQVQVRQQITNRRLLYVNNAIDITDELIERMNNAFNAGG